MIPFAIRKAAYIGWLGHGNLGDQMMYDAFTSMFQKLQTEPFRSQQSYDLVFLGGGTLINRDPFLGLFQEAQASCPQSYIFGTGVSSEEFWRTRPGWIDRRAQWLDCLHKANFVGVRGPLSRQALAERGINNVEIVGDLALSYAQPTVKPKKLRKHVGINIGRSYGNVWGSEQDILNFAVRAGSELIKRGWRITFVCVWPLDLGYVEEAGKMISSSKVAILDLSSASWGKTLSAFEGMDLFIGEKLHSVALAMCVYTPSIMLEYRPKCRDFMASMGLEHFSMRTDRLSLARLFYLIQQLYNNVPRYQNILKQRTAYYAQKQQQCANMIDARSRISW